MGLKIDWIPWVTDTRALQISTVLYMYVFASMYTTQNKQTQTPPSPIHACNDPKASNYNALTRWNSILQFAMRIFAFFFLSFINIIFSHFFCRLYSHFRRRCTVSPVRKGCCHICYHIFLNCVNNSPVRAITMKVLWIKWMRECGECARIVLQKAIY